MHWKVSSISSITGLKGGWLLWKYACPVDIRTCVWSPALTFKSQVWWYTLTITLLGGGDWCLGHTGQAAQFNWWVPCTGERTCLKKTRWWTGRGNHTPLIPVLRRGVWSHPGRYTVYYSIRGYIVRTVSKNDKQPKEPDLKLTSDLTMGAWSHSYTCWHSISCKEHPLPNYCQQSVW